MLDRVGSGGMTPGRRGLPLAERSALARARTAAPEVEATRARCRGPAPAARSRRPGPARHYWVTERGRRAGARGCWWSGHAGPAPRGRLGCRRLVRPGRLRRRRRRPGGADPGLGACRAPATGRAVPSAQRVQVRTASQLSGGRRGRIGSGWLRSSIGTWWWCFPACLGAAATPQHALDQLAQQRTLEQTGNDPHELPPVTWTRPLCPWHVDQSATSSSSRSPPPADGAPGRRWSGQTVWSDRLYQAPTALKPSGCRRHTTSSASGSGACAGARSAHRDGGDGAAAAAVRGGAFGRALWLSVAGALEVLARLAGDVQAAVRAAGVLLEARRWRPHLTVGRGRLPGELAAYQGPVATWARG